MKRGMAALAAAMTLAAGPALAMDDKAPPAPAADTAPNASTDARSGALLQVFQTFCRGVAASPAGIVAAAERRGLRPRPATDYKSLASLGVEDLTVRAGEIDGVQVMVAAGRQARTGQQGLQGLDVCVVGVTPSEPGAIRRFESWAGVAPVSRVGAEGDIFLFLEGPEGRRAVTTTGAEEMRRHVRDGDVRLLMVSDHPEGTLAVYSLMRPEI